MIYVAKIENGTVIQVTCCQPDESLDADQVIIGPANIVGIGWAYENGEFIPPSFEGEGV